MVVLVTFIVFIVVRPDIVSGSRPLRLPDDKLMAEFSRFASCMSMIQFNPDGCTPSEQCLFRLLDKANDYLDYRAEFSCKLEIKHYLDNLERDCTGLFDSGYKCQRDGMNACLDETSHDNGGICRKLLALMSCLGPYELDCPNRIFAAILRAISFGIWESSSCSSTGTESNSQSALVAITDHHHERGPSDMHTEAALPVYKETRLEDHDHHETDNQEVVEYRIAQLKSRSLVEANNNSKVLSKISIVRPPMKETNAALTDRSKCKSLLIFVSLMLLLCFALRNYS